MVKAWIWKTEKVNLSGFEKKLDEFVDIEEMEERVEIIERKENKLALSQKRFGVDDAANLKSASIENECLPVSTRRVITEITDGKLEQKTIAKKWKPASKCMLAQVSRAPISLRR